MQTEHKVPEQAAPPESQPVREAPNGKERRAKRTIVAGIGASAGGVEALRDFFAALPTDTGVAFVVIMHLSPEHRSELAALLSLRTAMPVTQVVETTTIEPNHVYVIPPGRRLLITDSVLQTFPFDEPRGQRAPIDQFFQSLALEYGDGFAIVLSGGGSDGASGLKEIKEQGGLILVQDPKEASFDGMPRSAIATGLADIVLPVRELAARIPELAHRKQRLQTLLEDVKQEQFSHDDEVLVHRILAHLQARTGHNFSQYKRTTVLRRMGRRMQLNRQDGLGEYLSFLREHAEEAQALFEDLLISVTTFFRDADAFQALQTHVVPKLFTEHSPDLPIRVWVAGCATGEEAYSLAILLLEEADRRGLWPEFQIFASDLAEGALATAREGCYPMTIEADVTPERLQRFFTQEGHFYRINRDVRDMVLFATHSLLKDPPFSRLDLISCRNLLIYLERDLQEQVLALFRYALRSGGFLFLGSAENTVGNLFYALDKKQRIFQVRDGKGLAPPRLPDLFLIPSGSRPVAGRGWVRMEAPSVALHTKLLEKLAPPSVVVDGQRNAVHLSETAGRYLLPPGGPLTTDVTDLVRPELQEALRSALYRAFEQGEASLVPPILVRFNGAAQPVMMLVQPQRQEDQQLWALVLFLESDDALSPTAADTPSDTHTTLTTTVQQLQEELRYAQERLRTIRDEYTTANEELRAANEEMQSINEEYRSTAEEAETSKEELQSVNEELHTVNSELKIKLDEIARAHSDLQNFTAATEGGTLFLDRELRINRFTPLVADLINVTPNDRGRVITDFTHRLDYDNLAQDARQVLHTLIPLEREIHGKDGRWHLMRLRPYHTIDNRIDGVVFTLVDITERRQAEEALRESEARRLLAVEAAGVGDWTLDLQTSQFFWSERVREIFGVEPQDAAALTFVFSIIHADDRAQAHAAIQAATAPASDGRYAAEFRVIRPDGAVRWVEARGQARFRVEDGKRHAQRIIGAMLDVTERREAEIALRLLNETLEERVEERTKQVQALAATLEQRVEERTKQVRKLASMLTMSEQEERRRISQILHDNLQQLLYGIQMRMMSLITDAERAEPTTLVGYAQEAYSWLNDAIRTTRQLTVDLSPPVLRGEGLVDALHWLATQMAEVYGLRVTLQAAHAFPIASEDMRVLLFQVVRELLFNTVKHAATDQATVELEEGEAGEVVITVSDSGRGFDVETTPAAHDGSFGLASIRERLGLFGGHMDIVSQPGDGTQVTVYAPKTVDEE